MPGRPDVTCRSCDSPPERTPSSDMSMETSQEEGEEWGRRERILSARESVGWREGPVTSRDRSTRRTEQRDVMSCEVGA